MSRWHLEKQIPESIQTKSDLLFPSETGGVQVSVGPGQAFQGRGGRDQAGEARDTAGDAADLGRVIVMEMATTKGNPERVPSRVLKKPTRDA